MPCRPLPDAAGLRACAMPTPSSCTRRCQRPCASSSVTSSRPAWACCSALLKASCTMAAMCCAASPVGSPAWCWSGTCQCSARPRRASTGCRRWRNVARRSTSAQWSPSMVSTSRRRSRRQFSSTDCSSRWRASEPSSNIDALTSCEPTASCSARARRWRSAWISGEGRGLRRRRQIQARRACSASQQPTSTAAARLAHHHARSPDTPSRGTSRRSLPMSQQSSANGTPQSSSTSKASKAARSARCSVRTAEICPRQAPGADLWRGHQNIPRNDAKRTAWARVRTCSLR